MYVNSLVYKIIYYLTDDQILPIFFYLVLNTYCDTQFLLINQTNNISKVLFIYLFIYLF